MRLRCTREQASGGEFRTYHENVISCSFQRHFLAVLTNLLWIMTEEHYQRYLKEFSNNKELKDFLVNVFVVFTEIVKRGIFLRDWIVIIVLGNRWAI